MSRNIQNKVIVVFYINHRGVFPRMNIVSNIALDFVEVIFLLLMSRETKSFQLLNNAMHRQYVGNYQGPKPDRLRARILIRR